MRTIKSCVSTGDIQVSWIASKYFGLGLRESFLKKWLASKTLKTQVKLSR